MGESVLPGAGAVLPSRRTTPALLVGIALAVLVGGYVAMLALRPGGSAGVVRVTDVTTTLAAAAAALACARAGRRHLAGISAFWWLMAAACASWAVGEATWAWYEVVLRVEVPYPSYADVGYLAGTPLAVAAFLCHPSARSHRRPTLVPLLDGLSVATATLLTSWLVVLGPLVAETGGLSLGDLISVAYPFGDVVLLVLVVLGLRAVDPADRTATLLLLGGLAAMAVTDSVYTYLAQVGGYESGSLVDSGWFAAYLAIAAGAFVARPHRGGARDGSTSPAVARLAPYVPVLAGLGMVAIEIPQGDLSRTEWSMSLALAAVVIVRHGLFVVHHRPGRRRAAAGPSRRLGQAPRPPAQRVAPVPGWSAGAAAANPSNLAELQALSLQIAAAARPTVEARVGKVSGSLAAGLAVTAATLAVWDMALLVQHGL
jgi:hypothetical protein